MREKTETEYEIETVNNRNGQADTYPKIGRGRKYKMTETLTERARKRHRGNFMEPDPTSWLL